MAFIVAFMRMRLGRTVSWAVILLLAGLVGAPAQTATPDAPKAAPSTPNTTSPSTTTPATPTPATPGAKPSDSKAPGSKAPESKEPGSKEPGSKATETKTPSPAKPGTTPDTSTPKPGNTDKPGNTEIEPHGSPGIPQNAQTESVIVPARPAVLVQGQSSYDDAFKSIKASLEAAKAALDKAGLKASGHPVTIFSEPDNKGFKYKIAIPIAAKPDGKLDLGTGTIGETPAGKAIKFQHRGAYEDIDSTYDVITAYLDAKGLQADTPYIEEYLTDLTTADDPNLQVDIYVFVK